MQGVGWGNCGSREREAIIRRHVAHSCGGRRRGMMTPAKWASSWTRGLIKGLSRHVPRSTRGGRLMESVKAADAPQLNAIACSTAMRRYVLQVNRSMFGPRLRREFLDVVVRERVQELNLESKLALATNLSPKSANDRAVLKTLLLSTSGHELTCLKRGIDLSQRYTVVDCARLFEPDDLEQIFDHISKQETAPEDERPILAISDIDDTLYASIHDRSFPARVLYPGMTTFLRALAQRPGGGVVFLTARPRAVTLFTHKQLERMGVETSTVVSGSFFHLASHAQMAALKFESFTSLEKFYPEFRFVFVGDSGQGDVRLAEMMLKSSSHVKLVLIHDVVSKQNVYKTPADKRAQLRSSAILVFDSYLEAAVESLKAGLIDRSSVVEIQEVIQHELARCKPMKDGFLEARLQEFDRAKQLAKDYV
ncbi:unnamed protein product (mitochondrion) [Plasmodiophora brassicae]|uniref:Phosphatidate phosphatase APP1 catalytic domain-containing protein n=1 Tax=Plasmodiophora brassicae TaxID=37360 RepID=A0A3P3YIT1_PLABS|nr:unnamed protein product [Plasmodiophora brassicae]